MSARPKIRLGLCVCCRVAPVMWPRVCRLCQDLEAQRILARFYEEEIRANPASFKCRSCGMLFDLGEVCAYCGDADPLDAEGAGLVPSVLVSPEVRAFVAKLFVDRGG